MAAMAHTTTFSRWSVRSAFLELSEAAQARAARLRRTASEGCLDLPLHVQDGRALAYLERIAGAAGGGGDGMPILATDSPAGKVPYGGGGGDGGSAATEAPSWGSGGGRWADMEDLESVAPEADGGPDVDPPCSQGSRGHPELCNRPCLRLAAGGCPLGKACLYCHMGHPPREPHLDRRSREILAAATASSWLAVMEAPLVAKVEASGSASAAALLRRALDQLRALEGGAALSLRQQRSLAAAVERVSMKALLSTASRTTRPRSAEVGDLLRDVLLRLRLDAGLPAL